MRIREADRHIRDLRFFMESTQYVGLSHSEIKVEDRGTKFQVTKPKSETEVPRKIDVINEMGNRYLFDLLVYIRIDKQYDLESELSKMFNRYPRLINLDESVELPKKKLNQYVIQYFTEPNCTEIEFQEGIKNTALQITFSVSVDIISSGRVNSSVAALYIALEELKGFSYSFAKEWINSLSAA